MAANSKPPWRARVERNIFRRAFGVYEVGFKDGTGKQRWRTVRGWVHCGEGDPRSAPRSSCRWGAGRAEDETALRRCRGGLARWGGRGPKAQNGRVLRTRSNPICFLASLGAPRFGLVR